MAGRLRRASDVLRSARDVLESLGQSDGALRGAELGGQLKDLFRDRDPAAARAYPGSVEQ